MSSVTGMVTKNGPQHQADWEYIASFHPEIAKALLDEIERLREVLQYVADAPTRVQAWLRAHGVAFENLDDRWQRVGFSLYNEVVEMSALAKAVLDEEEAEGTKPVGQRMDEADANLATRPVEQVVGELQAENRRLREVAERVVRANKDVERHGYASLRHMVYVLENVLREVQAGDGAR